MNKRIYIACLVLAAGFATTIQAQRFGRVDNLFEYIMKGQAEKYDKVRPDLKPKELEAFKVELDYADQLRKVLLNGPVDDAYEGYFQTFVNVNVLPFKNNIGLICTGMKMLPDSLKVLADNKIMAKLQASDQLQKLGRGILAAIDKTGYPVTDRYRMQVTDLIFNAQYSELLTTPTLERYRAFIVDWPRSDKLPSVKQNYDDALFAESQRTNDKDLYLLDDVLPNDTKKHMVPDDWSLLGDKQAEKGDYNQAQTYYNKSIALGSKEGLFKLTLHKHEGRIRSEEDELPIFQKLAAAGDIRARKLVEQIQNRNYSLAVEGNLESLIDKKDQARVVTLVLSGPVNTADLKVLKDMASKGKLTTLDLSAVQLSRIPDRAFQGCSQLTSLKLPLMAKAIGNEALAECSALNSVVLPDSLNELMASAFNNCSALTELTLPASLNKGLGYVTFCNGCKKLNNFKVADGNPAYSALDGVLYNKEKTVVLRYPCGKEASLYSFPNSIVEIGVGAFEGCTFLSSLSMTESLKTIKNAAFKGCSTLTAINIPSMVAEIGANAFEGCSRLVSVALPMFINEISSGTFKNCTALSDVSIPTTVKEIRFEAFSGCTNLTSVVLGVELKGLGDKVFQGCTGLRNITTAQATPQNISNIFEGVDSNSCVLHVPVGSLDVYKQFPVWNAFVNIVEQP